MENSDRNQLSSIELICYITHFEPHHWSSKKNSHWKPKGFKGQLMDETGYIDMFQFETPIDSREISNMNHNNSVKFYQMDDEGKQKIISSIRRTYHNKIRANNIVIIKGRKSSYKGKTQFHVDLIKESFNLANYSKEKLTGFMEKWSDGDSNVL